MRTGPFFRRFMLLPVQWHVISTLCDRPRGYTGRVEHKGRRQGALHSCNCLGGLSEYPLATTEGNRNQKRTSASLPEIPDKLYFRIGEVARLLDLPTYVLRFWETEFPQLKPNKGGTGQRLYRRRDVELAMRIRGLLYDEGYTIPGARQFLKSEIRTKEPEVTLPPDPPTDGVPASIRLRRMRSELREIASLLDRPAKPEESRPTNPSHRGLHMASPRKRPTAPLSTPLFPDEGSKDR
jgi:DNA-binding transcriptional MerR regulator